jgi:hypothetical protein
MVKYSKPEQQIMNATFKQLFKVNDEYLKAPAIEEWMNNAAIGIVEYDGRLKRESTKQRDRRMEIIEVYDGDINTLVNHLRNVYHEYRKTPKWEMIFKIYNEIMAAQKSIEQAELQLAFSKNEDAGEVPQTTEELQNNPSASTEESAGTVETAEPEVVQQEEQELADSGSSQVVHEEPQTETSNDLPSGNVQEEEAEPLFNKSLQNKEENSMSEIDEMLNAANKANPGTQVDPAKEQTLPGKANVSAPKGADNEAKARVAELLAGQKEQRKAWTRQNTVTAIISTQKPSALRTLSQMGSPVPGETDATKALEAINGKINKFIVAVSGVEGITQDAFEALPDEQKYANVVVKEGSDNIGKAAAIYTLYKQIKQNPLGEVGAYIPGADKVNYPTRGYMIGGTAYPEQEFIVQIIDNGVGALYGEGSMDAEGNGIGDKPVSFKIGIATRQEKAVSTGVNTAKKTSKVPVVRPANKKLFIAGGNHVEFLFTQEDTENNGTASFKAAITVGGEIMPATVSVYALDNGKKQPRSTKADGTVTYKTKVASLSVSVPVTKIKKEFAAAYRSADEDIIVTANRWGVQMHVEQAKGNFGNITEFSAAPVMDIFADVYAGNLQLSDTVRAGSASVKLLQNAANKQAEDDAAQSADELA